MNRDDDLLALHQQRYCKARRSGIVSLVQVDAMDDTERKEAP